LCIKPTNGRIFTVAETAEKLHDSSSNKTKMGFSMICKRCIVSEIHGNPRRSFWLVMQEALRQDFNDWK
jgi:hypothetical protein